MVFTIYPNGDFETSDGYEGTYRYRPSTGQVRMTYDIGTVYSGVVNGTCAAGTTTSLGGGQGQWSGCI